MESTTSQNPKTHQNIEEVAQSLRKEKEVLVSMFLVNAGVTQMAEQFEKINQLCRQLNTEPKA